MSAIAKIRQLIQSVKLGAMFTTRDCLSFGSRGAIDQALYTMVKARLIMRVTRGVFIKNGSQLPSILEVAKIKASSFGKEIFMHGSDAAHSLGFPSSGNTCSTFACTGRSSSFRYADQVIYFRAMSPRKLHGKNSTAGKVIRSLWHLGKEGASQFWISETYHKWSKCCPKLRQAAPLLPSWMNNLFYWAKTESRNTGFASRAPQPIDWVKLFPEYADLFCPNNPPYNSLNS